MGKLITQKVSVLRAATGKRRRPSRRPEAARARHKPPVPAPLQTDSCESHLCLSHRSGRDLEIGAAHVPRSAVCL